MQAFKKGPDYIDAMWLATATQRSCYNLDFWVQSENEMLTMFGQHNDAADIGIIEGNKGLYDGLAADGSNSNAALARLVGAPVILVLDTRGTTRGIAPLLLGYQQFDPCVHIAGVILNFVGGDRHAAKLRAVIERYTDLPVVGVVHRSEQLELVERYLGLKPSNEAPQQVAKKIDTLARMISDQVDLELLSSIAKSAKHPGYTTSRMQTKAYDLSIAYAKDEAFGFYYADDLDCFREFGVRMIPFNTLKNSSLPGADALLIGGGFPEKRLQGLSANTGMKQAIRDAIENGMPAYAECGGLMYLCNSIRYRDLRAEMAGIIDADCEMHEKPIGRGYTRLEKTAQHLWGAGGEDGFPGHEFHYSKLTRIPKQVKFAYRVKRGYGVDGVHDGIVHKNLLACYTHQRNTRQHQWIVHFLNFVKNHKDGLQLRTEKALKHPHEHKSI